MTLIRNRPNRPTEEGKMLGVELARLTQTEIDKASAAGVTFTPCKSCAFRAGTIPNGCPTTLMDAIKCLAQREPFSCHEQPNVLCQGFAANMWALGESDPVDVPWEYSPNVAGEQRG